MVRYELKDALNLIIAYFEQEVTAGDVLGFFEAIERDPSYRPSMNGLVDMRGASVLLGAERIRELAQYAAEGAFKQGKWALLVTDPKATAFAMLYRQGVGKSYPVQVFSSIDGAAAYLGVDLSGLQE